ncbi:hypothetical protein P5673_004142 [Acropora cervicornis]|uniref:Uncharacterized protein n=1 Tax=Acropora cervicornis TaxID=6130 RepID=A0AAD9R2H3_ACRCE|nr:hypothetical protein P5673_004142 [Acropora cervicornis]
MSSDSNDFFDSDSSESSIDFEESGDEHAPYQDELLTSDGEQDEESEDADLDGLTPSVLEGRFERRVAVSEWLVNHVYLFVNLIKQRNRSVIIALPCFRCNCKQCSDETLADALEFRFCREVTNAKRQLVFDGSIETISCITQHEDYIALTNRTVLLQVAPLLHDQNGRAYRRRTGVHENE